MKMGTCNVHIMDGHLMDAVPAHGFLRLYLKDLKLGQSSLRELALLDFLQWCPKVFFSFGLMRMDGKEPNSRNHPCNYSSLCLQLV